MLTILLAAFLVSGHANRADCPCSDHQCTVLTGETPLDNPRSVHLTNLWTDGVVPYRFAPDVVQSNRDRTREVMDEIESWCDVRFVPYTGVEPNWVTIRNSPPGQGNSATVGQQAGGVVNIVLWESKGMILHELMHTLGFLHEQSRADRDQYIELAACAFQNGNYNIAPGAPMVGPYDFDSVTHYTPLWGCAGGAVAFQIRQPYANHYQSSVGTWHFNYRGLSHGDIWALYKLYGGDPVPGPFGYTGPDRGSTVQVGQAVELSWEVSELADSYRVEIDRSSLFRFPLRTVETQQTSVTVDGLAPGRYFWRCAAVNGRGSNYPRPKPNDVWSFVVVCSPADMAEPYGTLNAMDVTAFLGLFMGQDPGADLNGDATHDFFDVSAYLGLYGAGCP